MRDQNKGYSKRTLEVLQFDLHFLAQLAVQRRQRFVQQKQFRFVHDGAGQRDPLLLAARHFPDAALFEAFQTDEAEDFADFLLDLGFRRAGISLLEAVADVLLDRQMREEGVVLKDHVDRPAVGLEVVDDLAVEKDLTAGGRFEPCKHA